MVLASITMIATKKPLTLLSNKEYKSKSMFDNIKQSSIELNCSRGLYVSSTVVLTIKLSKKNMMAIQAGQLAVKIMNRK